MKSNLLKKAKWYIIGVILVAILLSVSLSFCSWDTLSINAALNNNAIGQYKEHVKLVEDNYLADGAPGSNGQVDVGDIVTFGRYYQDKNATTASEHRWIVVEYESKSNIATLLSEKVVVYGNFWGKNSDPYSSYQNYYQSTLRSWLNSGKGSVILDGTSWSDSLRDNDNMRNDGVNDIKFNINEANQANKGFLDVAFNSAEKSLIVPKTIQNIKGAGVNNNPSQINSYQTSDNKNYVNDLIWIPSYKEIYAQSNFLGVQVEDGSESSHQFSYFKNKVTFDNSSYPICAEARCGATDYAWDAISTSYYNNGNGATNASQDITWWWLRSPMPLAADTLIVVPSGLNYAGYAMSYASHGGVRPAVNVKL